MDRCHCTFRIFMLTYLWGIDWIPDLSKCHVNENKIIDTGVFSLTLACICYKACDAVNLEITVHPHSLQVASPDCLEQNKGGGQGGDAGLCVREGAMGCLEVSREGHIFQGWVTCSSLPCSQALSPQRPILTHLSFPLPLSESPPTTLPPSYLQL